MQRYRLILAITWLTGGAIIVLTMITQATLGRYGANAKDAFEWLFPNIFPTLTLVLGVTGFTKAGTVKNPESTRTLFILTTAASIFYLIVLAMPIFLQPFVSGDPIESLRQSSIWLGMVQGLTTTLLGVFFTRETPKGAD